MEVPNLSFHLSPFPVFSSQSSLLSGLSCSFGSSAPRSKVSVLSSGLSGLWSEISDLRSQVSCLKSQVSGFRSKLSGLRSAALDFGQFDFGQLEVLVT